MTLLAVVGQAYAGTSMRRNMRSWSERLREEATAPRRGLGTPRIVLPEWIADALRVQA